LLYVLTPWLNLVDYRVPRWASWPGVGFFGLGLVLRWLAHRALGRHYASTTTVWRGQELVTEGIYAYIRHPIYAALWLWALAQPLLLWNWVAGLSGLVSVSALYALRVPREEAMLRAHFGVAYDDYAARTGRVIPRLGRR
jgi:protein-S-isoprenylcysteine O-methyltransferase Ste14